MDDVEEKVGQFIPDIWHEVATEYRYLAVRLVGRFRNTFLTFFGIRWQDFRTATREAWLQYGFPPAKSSSTLARSYVGELGDEVLPPELPQPYSRGYTAVISAEALLSMYTPGMGVEKRPGADLFVTLIGSEYELILWTHQDPGAYFEYLESFDPMKENVAFILYRSDCSSDGSMLYKDLSRLGRDLSKVIFVESEHLPLSIVKNKDNVIVVPQYDFNMEDTTLLDILPFFYDIILKQEDDVRVRIKETQNPEWLDFMFKNRLSYLKDMVKDPPNSPWRNLDYYLGFKPVPPLPADSSKSKI